VVLADARSPSRQFVGKAADPADLRWISAWWTNLSGSEEGCDVAG
jgi:hypothetical protein